MEMQNTVDQVKAKANGKWTEAQNATQDAGKQAKGLVDQVSTKASSVVDTAQESISKFMDSAPSTAQDYGNGIAKWAKANPVPLAIGGGLLLGYIAFKIFSPKKA